MVSYPQTHHQCWGQGQKPLFLPRESSLCPTAPWLSTHPTDTGQVHNGIKRGGLSGTMDYRLGLGRVILSSLPFLHKPCSRIRFPLPAGCCFTQALCTLSASITSTHQHPSLPAVPGTMGHPDLLTCNLSLCTWMVSRQDHESTHLCSSAPEVCPAPAHSFLPSTGAGPSASQGEHHTGALDRGISPGPKEAAHWDLILGRLPCPGTMPTDVESWDHILKHPAHAILLPLPFFHLSGAVGAGRHIPMVMGGQLTTSRFDAKWWRWRLTGMTMCPSLQHPPHSRWEWGPTSTSPGISKGALLVHSLLKAFNYGT